MRISNRKLCLIFLAILAVLSFNISAADIVRKGKSVAEIRISPRANEAELFAAQELQTWIGEITGAYIPINTDDGLTFHGETIFLIGPSFLPKDQKWVKDDLRAIGDTDGFAVRTDDTQKKIYLFGKKNRGTIHAVCEFLERNTDIIWYRPDSVLGTVFTKTDTLTVKDADFIEVPKSKLRGWQWTYHSPNTKDTLWQSRNRLNRLSTQEPKYASMYVSAGYGHGIQHFINPKEYFESHPEYYPFIKGKRTYAGGQICLTAYQMIPEYVNNIRKELDRKFPGVRPAQLRVDYLNLSIGDNWHVCNCPECLKPFKTETGETIGPNSPVFRSAQYYTFINKVARELKKTHPQVDIGVYAYIFTAEPPPFPLEKNICIQYCPFVMNEKFPIYNDTVNAKWHKFADGWGAVCKRVWLREYFGDASMFYRAQEYRVRDNGLYFLKHNITEFSCEHPLDTVSTACPDAKPSWDASALTAWVVNRLWWNPEQDIEKLRDTYFTRVYREAAPAMKEYYNMLRDSFYGNNLPSIYSDELAPLVSTYIVRSGLAEKCNACFQKALKTVKHPVSKALLERQYAQFQNWLELVKNDKLIRLNVPVVTQKDDITNNFDEDFWNKAADTGDFIVADHGERHGKKAKYRSRARLCHDRLNLYIRYDCYADDMATLKGNVKQNPFESCPRGDIMEFFLGDGGTGIYYQFMFDIGNADDHTKDVVYDAKGQEASWTCPWQRSIKLYPDKWVAIIKIPLADIGVNVTQNNKILFQAIRGKYYDIEIKQKDGTVKQGRKREMASWTGGWVHQMDAFGELTLNMD